MPANHLNLCFVEKCHVSEERGYQMLFFNFTQSDKSGPTRIVRTGLITFLLNVNGYRCGQRCIIRYMVAFSEQGADGVFSDR